MGKVTGFMEFDRQDRHYKPAADRIRNFDEFVIPLERPSRTQAARAAWIAASRFATAAARSTTRFRTGMIWSISADWEAASATCTRPTISRNSPAASARRPARRPARSTSTTTRSPSRPSSARLSTRPGKKAGSSRKSPDSKTGKRVAVVGSGPAGMAAPSNLPAPATTSTSTRRQAKAGGLLRYGIPDFKMEKHSSTAAWSRWRPRASTSIPAYMSA